MPVDSPPTSRSSWPGWAESLHRLGLENLAAWLLEAAGPLSVVGAQLLYFSAPLFSGARLETLAGLLEDHDETLAFSAFLREAGSQ
jgi:hypothetical protein